MEKRRLSAVDLLRYAQRSPEALPGGLTEEERRELRRDWYSLHSMEVAFSRIRAAEARQEGKDVPELWEKPGQRVEGFHEKDTRKSGEKPPLAIFAPPEGEYLSHPVEVDGEMIYLETSKDQSADDLRRNALELVAAKLTEYAPRARYAPVAVHGHPGLRVERVDEEPFLFAVWDTVRQLFTGEIDARQCRWCGKWEVKGEGFLTTKWTQHPRCGTRVRVRAFRRKEAEREKAEDREFFED